VLSTILDIAGFVALWTLLQMALSIAFLII
jgi:hypothetical protein